MTVIAVTVIYNGLMVVMIWHNIGALYESLHDTVTYDENILLKNTLA